MKLGKAVDIYDGIDGTEIGEIIEDLDVPLGHAPVWYYKLVESDNFQRAGSMEFAFKLLMIEYDGQ